MGVEMGLPKPWPPPIRGQMEVGLLSARPMLLLR